MNATPASIESAVQDPVQAWKTPRPAMPTRIPMKMTFLIPGTILARPKP